MTDKYNIHHSDQYESIMYEEINAVCCEIRTEHKYTVWAERRFI